MKKSVCLSQDSNLGSLIYLYGLIQPIRGRNRVKSGVPPLCSFLAEGNQLLNLQLLIENKKRDQ